ncbi:hypothetical protein N7478_012080 [Penicillium angulare]|uniref:uncharacterized protein n=1 Tax=Penicillium angulare TaxID=116970 RepID=UPI00253FFBEE|nr:uncharacterized protein N7478_012080 [Penicillium angulare]KAJ5260475.1 hypothetical protein N7478_012080 [Penicillium angulare]
MEYSSVPPIAIIGMSGRYPGDASSPEKLWEMIANARSARSEVPADRFNIDAFYHPYPERGGTLNSRGGHFMQHTPVDAFDAPFFSITANEAQAMDPQQRWSLECTYEAIENAGLRVDNLAGSDTSVYVGTFTKDYSELLSADTEDVPIHYGTGTGTAIVSNRVSWFFDLRGPSVSMDTGCSSSLVALHMACQGLRTGESKISIVGGVNLILLPGMMTAMSNQHFLSPDDTCHSFDAAANGYSRGEGASFVILKRLDKALADGDIIRGVIRNTALNQDGKTPGITVPSATSQEALIRRCYSEAGLRLDETSYVEAHGTGTPVGDPQEAAALARSLGVSHTSDDPLLIGSIKTNIGHLEGASGMVQVQKAIFSLEKGLLAPTLWFENPNPRIPFSKWNLQVVSKLRPFPQKHAIRRVSVNSFGYGGTNAHCIIDSAEDYLQVNGLMGHHNSAARPIDYSSSSDSGFESEGSLNEWNELRKQFGNAPKLAIWSSNEQSGIQRSAQQLAEYLKKNSESKEAEHPAKFKRLLHTLASRRSLFPWRSFALGDNMQQLSQTIISPTVNPKRAIKPAKLAFVFTGQGAQWYAMGRQLCAFRSFWRSLVASNNYLISFGCEWSLLDEFFSDEDKSRIEQSEFSQPMCTALQVALLDLFNTWGISPGKVIGHSSGEIGAAYAIGAITHEQAIKLSYHRGRLCAMIDHQKTTQACGMMAVGHGVQAMQPYLSGTPTTEAVVACINSPDSVTISGTDDTLKKIQQRLEEQGVFARRLKVKTAYHSPHMNVIANEYLSAIQDVQPKKCTDSSAVMFSSVTGKLIQAEDLVPFYWVRNLTSPVDFSGAARALLRYQPGSKLEAKKPSVTAFLEIGPHGALQGPLRQILSAQGGKFSDVQSLSALDRKKDASISAVESAGMLFQSGFPVQVQEINETSDTDGFLVDLPSFAWNRNNRYWPESDPSKEHRFRKHPRTDLLGVQLLGTTELEPMYRNILKQSEIPWLENHKVQGTILYPAAGMLVLAIEGARRHTDETREVAGFEIRDVIIGKAVVIPENNSGSHIMLSMRPWRQSTRDLSSTWSEFKVHSRNDDEWEVNCTGLIRAKYKSTTNDLFYDEASHVEESHRQHFAAIQENCTVDVNVENHYSHMKTIGLDFTGAFKSLTKIRRGDNMSNCQVTVHDTKSMMPHEFEFPHVVHPSTLDCIIQSGLAGSTNVGEDLTVALIPTAIEHMYVSVDISSQPGTKLDVATKVVRQGAQDDARGNMYVFQNDKKEPVLDMSGVKCTALRHGELGLAQAQVTRKLAARVEWREALEWLDSTRLGDMCKESMHMLGSVDRVHIANMELAAWIYMRRVLQTCSPEDAESFAPHFRKFYALMQNTERRVLEERVPHQAGDPKWLQTDHDSEKDFLHRISNSGPDGAALCAHGESLVPIMRGERLAIEVLSQNDYLNNFYQYGLGYDRIYAQLASYIGLLGHQRPHMKILEIGGGTGGATLPILQELTQDKGAPRFATYTFTDISTGFFEKAELKFKPWLPFMKFNKFDVESDPASQGLKLSDFDVVVAANSIHATSSMERTLGHVRSLMKPGAKLILVEITNPLLRMHMTVGSFDGWWAGADDSREWGPTMTEDEWNVRLKSNGFSGVELACQDFQDLDDQMYSLVVSTAVDKIPALVSVPKQVVIVQPKNVTSEVDSSLTKLANSMRIAGATVNVNSIDNLGKTEVNGKVVLFALGLNSYGELDSIDETGWEALKHSVLQASSSTWLSRGACVETQNPNGSLMTGMARCIRAENPSVALTTIDLDPISPLDDEKSLALLFDVFSNSCNSINTTDPDWEYAIRNNTVLTPRLFLESGMNEWISTLWTEPQAEHMTFKQLGRNLRLKASTPGQLHTLCFEDDHASEQSLGLDEVEIEVKAVGLNFKDVMIAMGQLTNMPLGLECSGIVHRIGSNVTNVCIGDRVTTWTLSGTFKNYVRTASIMCAIIPDALSYEIAASLPIVYSTAYYSLFEAARIKRGESILIHAAAGGLGQATINIAKHVGAEIFATVSSREKKNLLMQRFGISEQNIFSSRDNEFLKGVMRVTRGRGVDIVINSLARDALQDSLKCLKPFGRFLELGQKDIESNTGLGMVPFLKNLSFHAINMIMVQQYTLQTSSMVFQAVMELFNRGMLSPILPTTAFPISDLEKGFRSLQTGQHMGKVVFTIQDSDMVPVIPPKIPTIQLDSSSTYLISGGLGGIGRSIATWMVEAGARNIVFLSRSGTSKPAARETIAILEAAGARTKVYSCDCGDAQQMRDAMQLCSEEFPPIKGVIQAAMVLKDSLFENMDVNQFHEALHPKVQGSRNLHDLVPGSESLDFFIMLASSAGIAGSRGQCNYAAGNAYQDALATHRRARGLRATSLDLGVILDVGLIAELLAEGSNKDVAENIARWKYAGLYEKEVLAMLQAAMTQQTLHSRTLPPQLITGLGTGGMADVAGVPIPWWLMDAKFAHIRTVDTHRKVDESSDDTQGVQALISQATTLEDATGIVSIGLVRKLAKMLMVDVEDIEPEKPITRYGIDSLLAVELRSWIFMDIQADVSVFQLMSNVPITELARQIAVKSKCLPRELHDQTVST